MSSLIVHREQDLVWWKIYCGHGIRVGYGKLSVRNLEGRGITICQSIPVRTTNGMCLFSIKSRHFYASLLSEELESLSSEGLLPSKTVRCFSVMTCRSGKGGQIRHWPFRSRESPHRIIDLFFQIFGVWPIPIPNSPLLAWVRKYCSLF